jgi:CDP-glycerol glycerophosphotransferase
MTKEDCYVQKRLWKARLQSLLFYFFRIFPIKRNKIVFTTIEGTTGFSCNPKYIAKELLRREAGCELVWLVNDMSKQFPYGIRKVHNTLWNRAYELTTAAVWIDNSRKQLEVRKRKKQLYLQTWHANICLKPIGLQRGKSFSHIAYLVSKHDSNFVDYFLSDAEYYEKHILPDGALYNGPALRFGTPRCDILVNERENMHHIIRQRYHLSQETKIVMYAPTFRGGSQGTHRSISTSGFAPDYDRLLRALEKRFGGSWVVFLRLHPQLTARHIQAQVENSNLIDVSRADDMYELLAGCDALVTDYSSVSFDTLVTPIPAFLYVEDYRAYEAERGKLLWNLDELPFPWAMDNDGLETNITAFDEKAYVRGVQRFLDMAKMAELGTASARTVDFIMKWLNGEKGGMDHANI